MRLSVIAAGLVLVLAGCNRADQEDAPPPAPAEPAAPAAPTGYEHEAGFDAAGYYRTETPVQSGNFKLAQIAVGAPSDFQQWEAGEREAVFGPILMQFDDVTSPKGTNEMGGEHHTVSIRVLPAAYRMGPGQVVFQAKDDKVGEILFDGAFDTAALAQAKANGNSDGKPVLTGSLQIGQERIRNISFSYWAGD